MTNAFIELMKRRQWIALWYTSILWVTMYATNDLAIKYIHQDLSGVLGYSIGGFKLVWAFAAIVIILIPSDWNRDI